MLTRTSLCRVLRSNRLFLKKKTPINCGPLSDLVPYLVFKKHEKLPLRCVTFSKVYKIYRAFNRSPSLQVRGISLNIFKAFDKVWYHRLLFKLESFGIRGELFNLLEDYLSNRSQRVLLYDQESSWFHNKTGVPQGSILGPLLFLIHINDPPDGLSSTAKFFADDASLFSIVHDLNELAK